MFVIFPHVKVSRSLPRCSRVKAMSTSLIAVGVAVSVVTIVDLCKHLVARRAPRERSTCYEIMRWIPNAVKTVAAAVKIVFDPRPNFGSFGCLVAVTFHSDPIPALANVGDLCFVTDSLDNAKQFDYAMDELDGLDQSTDKIPMNIQYEKVVTHILPASVNIENVTAVEIESLGTDYQPEYDVFFPGTMFHFNPTFSVDKVIEALLRVVYTNSDGEQDEEEKEEEEGVVPPSPSSCSSGGGPFTLEIDVTDTVRPWSRAITKHGLERVAPFILRDVRNMYTEIDEVLAFNEPMCLELTTSFASLNKTVFSV